MGALLLGTSLSVACDLPAGETATVASVEDGETLELTDGRKVRLLGVKAPAPPLGWKGENFWLFVAEAKAGLSGLLSGAEVELRFDERREDRYGHVLAQVTVLRGEDRVWLQDNLVARGLAQVYSLSDTRACVTELLAREEEARQARRRVWRSPGPIACRTRPTWSAWGVSPTAINWSRARSTRWARGGSSSM
ncbi:MAG TPA: thermonuclease family protein [Methyloceanibacter sp.]|nr:thermonuclease family protein [Methyloceanibacter sp.]